MSPLHTHLYTLLGAKTPTRDNIWTWTTHLSAHAGMIYNTHSYAAAHICWIRRILHGRLPDNTDEDLDWTKLPVLMKTNSMDGSQVLLIRGRNFQLNATLHQISAIVLCGEQQTYCSCSVSSAIKLSSNDMPDAASPAVCPQKVKGQSARCLRRIS